jgi:ABC-type Zn uptake system ZnuABC Zn-binding protein ZnuA
MVFTYRKKGRLNNVLTFYGLQEITEQILPSFNDFLSLVPNSQNLHKKRYQVQSKKQ